MAGTILGYFVLQETNQMVINRVRSSSEDIYPTESDALLPENQIDGIQAPQPKTMWEMFQSQKVVLSLLLYTLVSFIYIQFDIMR